MLNHEYKHYDVDHAAILRYEGIFHHEIIQLIRQTGIIGPYLTHDAEKAKAFLSERIHTLISQINKRMEDERHHYQAKIDTPEEYERVAQICRGQKKH